MRACCFSVISAVAFSASTLIGGVIWLDWATDREPVSYRVNETMTFRVRLVEDGKPLAGKLLKWTRTGDDKKTVSGETATAENGSAQIEASIGVPGFVRMEVWPFHGDKTPLNGANGRPLKFDGGAGADIGKLEPYPEPADFDAFWQNQKLRLAGVPVKASLREITPARQGFRMFDVRVDCAGGKPVSGYLSFPDVAKPRSLGAHVGFIGYGARSATQDYRRGMIVFQINAHGIENGREPAYYQALQTGELKGYGFNAEENARPETCYFNGMMLRVMRALEFVKSRPEWDGKTLTVFGSSQGGFQAVAAAGLDPAVTECVLLKPWFCDLGGITLGRLRGWRPDLADGLLYYDGVSMGKRITCKTVITAGLGDYTCPPSGLAVLYNRIKAPKRMEYLQGVAHGYETPPNPPEPAKQTVSDGPCPDTAAATLHVAPDGDDAAAGSAAAPLATLTAARQKIRDLKKKAVSLPAA